MTLPNSFTSTMLNTSFYSKQQTLDKALVKQVVHLPLELQQQLRQLNLHREHQPILDMQIEESRSISYKQHLTNQLYNHLHETIKQQMELIKILCEHDELIKERMNKLYIELDNIKKIKNIQPNQYINKLLDYLYENVNNIIQMIQIIFEQHKLTENQIRQYMDRFIVIKNEQNMKCLIYWLHKTVEHKESIIQTLIAHHRLIDDQIYKICKY